MCSLLKSTVKGEKNKEVSLTKSFNFYFDKPKHRVYSVTCGQGGRDQHCLQILYTKTALVINCWMETL